MRAWAPLLGALCVVAGGNAQASALRVAPVGLDLPYGQNATTLALRNDDQAAMNVQVRVFRWRQIEGRDVLEPTIDVVVSPPITKLEPGANRTIRVVRLNTAGQGSEEAYRVLVDELPPPPSEVGRAVTLLMRHSIPLFFGGGDQTPKVVWTVEKDDKGLSLKAVNQGGRRLRISDVALSNQAGTPFAERRGLVGYVLPGSEMRWTIGGEGGGDLAARLTLATDIGAVNVPLADR